MSNDQTSEPGKGSDPLEPDFEKLLQDEGLELEGRKTPEKEDPAPEKPKPEDAEAKAKADEEAKVKADADEKAKADEEAKKGKTDKPREEWRDMIAKRRQEKAKSAEDKAKADPPKLDPDPSKPPKEAAKKEEEPTAPELTPAQKEFAEKYGIEPEDMIKAFPPAKVEKIENAGGLSKEDRDLLNETRAERDALLIEKGFTTDFDTNVLPLLKAEYPGISDEKVSEIKKQIFEKLHDEKFAAVPLDILYTGDKAFRGLVTPPKKGVDNGSRVPAKGTSGKVYDFENVTEEDVKNPDFPFNDYSDYMAKKEKESKRS